MSVLAVVASATEATSENKSSNFDTGRTAVVAYLDGLTDDIRVFVSNSADFVQQASSITVLRNLVRVRTATAQSYTLVYDDRGTGGAGGLPTANLLAAIQQLLPMMQISGTTATMPPIDIAGKTVTVTFTPISDASLKSSPVELGITGGYSGELSGLAGLGVSWFVELQPPRASSDGSQNAIWEPSSDTTKSLDDLDELGNKAFNRRVYYDTAPAEPDWTALGKLPQGNLKTTIPMAEAVASAATNKQANAMVLTGIASGSLDGLSCLLNATGAALDAQDADVSAAAKAVVLDLSGGPYVDQFSALMSADPSIGTASFKAYWNADRRRRVVALSASSSVAEVQQALAALSAKGVIVLSLGPLPTDVVGYLASIATLPAMFSDAAQGNLAANFEQPYLWLRPSGSSAATFFPIDPQSDELGVAATELVTIAASVPTSRRAWAPAADAIPPTVIAEYVQKALSAAGGDIADYYTAVAAEYHAEENDKLLNALVYFVEYKKCPQPPDGILDKLFADLQGAVSEGTLNLFKRFPFSGPAATAIGTLLKSFAGADAFNITGSDKNPVKIEMPTAAKVVVSGSTGSLIAGETLAVTLTFTQVLCDVGVSIEASFTGTWQIVPWFALGEPKIAIDMGNIGSFAPKADLSAVVCLGQSEMTLGLPVPIVDDTWQLSGTFTKDPPTLADAFQLVGGMNLIEMMPAQVRGFTTIELQAFAISYNQKSGAISSFGLQVAMTGGTPWTLISGAAPNSDLVIDSMTAAIVVVNPGNVNTRKVGYQFDATLGIGTGENAGKLAIAAHAPDFTVTAGIPDDSKPIQLADLAGIFVKEVPTFVSGELSKFNLLVKPADPTTFSLETEIDADWGFDVPGLKTRIEVTQLGFAVGAVGDERSGRVYGQFQLGTTNPVTIFLSADYDSTNGWVLEGKQTQGTIKVGPLATEYTGLAVGDYVDIEVEDLHATIKTKTKEYSFGGKATWNLPFGDQVKLIGTAEVAYKKVTATEIGTGESGDSTALAVVTAADASPFSGKLCGTLMWGDDAVELQFCYLFGDDEKCPYQFSAKLGGVTVTGKACQEKQGDPWIGHLSTTGLTLGGIIETLVGWATGQEFGLSAPWNVLDEIPLDFNLTFNFTTKKTTLEFPLDIELGFATIKGINLVYNPDATGVGDDRKVSVELTGTFVWLEGGELPKWDATKPETTPAPEGGGNKYFDLRLLGLGQHVAIEGSRDFENVEDAIAKIRAALDEPSGCKIPVGSGGEAAEASDEGASFVYSPDSSWLIAADFGVLKFGGDGNGETKAVPAGTEGA